MYMHTGTPFGLIFFGMQHVERVDGGAQVLGAIAALWGFVACGMQMCRQLKALGRATPLHQAAYFGHVQVCELLLENKADMAAASSNGCAA